MTDFSSIFIKIRKKVAKYLMAFAVLSILFGFFILLAGFPDLALKGEGEIDLTPMHQSSIYRTVVFEAFIKR